MPSTATATHSVLLLWILAGCCFWGAHYLWRLGQQGSGGANLGAILLVLMGAGLSMKGLHAWDRWSDFRHVQKQAQQTANAHGRSRLAKPQDVKAAGLYGRNGMFLGRFCGRDLYYPGESNAMVIASIGMGKGACVAIPDLLMNRNSMVVLDLKGGELCAVTARHRRERLGHEIIVLNPDRIKLAEELGVDMGDAGFSPASFIRPGLHAKDDAEMFSQFVLPGEANERGSTKFFNDFGREILTTFMLAELVRTDSVWLTELRKRLMCSPRELEDQLTRMASTDAFSGALREYANKLLNTLANAPEQFEGGYGTALAAVRIYDSHGPLGKHVNRGSFDFRTMKQGRPKTVYIVLSSDRANHLPWVNTVFSTAMELIGRDSTNRRVVFQCDELASMGYVPNLLRNLALKRAQGIQARLYLQQASQARRIYGPDGWRDMVGLCEVLQVFGTFEQETLKLLSEMSGQASIQDINESLRLQDARGQREDFSFSSRHTSTPLLRPEDIRGLPDNRQLIYYRNMHPLIAEKVDYRSRRQLRRWTDPNPYYQKKG